MVKIVSNLLIMSIAIFLFSCNAPRNNPLDPLSSNYKYGSIKGTVQTFSVPYTAIPGVSVYWQQGDVLVKTDSSGNFSINNIKPVNGKLIYTKSGFNPDTVIVAWNNSRTYRSDVNLNTIPTLDSISIYSVVIKQFYPAQTSQLVIDTKIRDVDNDIKSVYVENSYLGLKKALDFNVSSKIYQTQLSTTELNVQDIQETIGLQFNIVVQDIFNNQFVVGSDNVTRVIKDGVLLKQPANDTTTSANPTLIWQRFTPGYSFTYMLEVYTNDFANSQLVLQVPNISPDSISYSLTQNLTSGNYYWVIWVIDQFNNRIRSLPATFTVP